MPHITFQTSSGDMTTDVPSGTTILAAAQELGVDLTPRCGGNGSCGLCRVRLVSGTVQNDPTDEERQHLGSANFAAGERLGCCAEVGEEDVVVVRED